MPIYRVHRPMPSMTASASFWGMPFLRKRPTALPMSTVSVLTMTANMADSFFFCKLRDGQSFFFASSIMSPNRSMI